MLTYFLLIQTYGVSKHKHSGNGHLGGARIGIVAKPSVEFVAGILGTWFSGGVAVPLALSYPEAELLHVMNDSVRPEFTLFYFLVYLSVYERIQLMFSTLSHIVVEIHK